MLHGGVMALAAKFGSKFDVIKNLVGAGKSPLSKEIAGLSEETWNSIVNKNKSLIGRMAQSLKEVGKEQGKMIGTFGLLAPGATALADNALGYEHKSLGEIGGELAHSVKEMVIGSSLLIGVGLAKGLSSHTANPIEKAAIWDMADNPDIGKERIDEAVQSGELTADKGEQRKKEIDNISALVEKVPLKNDKGNPLTDAERVNYLYDLAVSKKNKDAAKNLPSKQSEAAIKESKVADYRNSILLEDYTDKQREDRKTALDKILNPKDIDGKKQEVPDNIRLETEAELQALNEATPKEKVVNPILQKLEGNEVLNNIKGDDEGKIDYLKEQAISAPESFGRKIKDEETHIDLISQNTKENIEEAIKYQEKRLGEDNADVEVIDKGITLLEKGLAKKNEQPIVKDINSQLKTTDNGKETNAQAQAEEERQKENVLTTDGNTAPDEKGAVTNSNDVKGELPINITDNTKTNINEKANESNGQSMLDRVSEAGDKSKVGEDSEQLRKEEEVKKLEVQRDNEIDKVSKPDLKLNLVSSRELIKTKDPVGNKEIHDTIKEKYKKLKLLIECL